MASSINGPGQRSVLIKFLNWKALKEFLNLTVPFQIFAGKPAPWVVQGTRQHILVMFETMWEKLSSSLGHSWSPQCLKNWNLGYEWCFDQTSIVLVFHSFWKYQYHIGFYYKQHTKPTDVKSMLCAEGLTAGKQVIRNIMFNTSAEMSRI